MSRIPSIAAVAADRFGRYNENSMSTELTNSSASVLLRLREEYPVENDDFENALGTLEQHAVGDNANRRKQIIQHFKGKKITEPLSGLDTAQLYDPETKTYRESEIFTLKETLTLVVFALRDDLKFTHHYPKDEEGNPLTKAQKEDRAREDQAARFEVLFNRLDELTQGDLGGKKWRCHQGWRNEIIGTLDRNYPDVEIIQEPYSIVAAVIKEEIAEKDLTKPELKPALLHWMENSDANMIVDALQLNGHIQSRIQDLFGKHGLGPNEIKKLMTDSLAAIEFSPHEKKNRSSLRCTHY